MRRLRYIHASIWCCILLFPLLGNAQINTNFINNGPPGSVSTTEDPREQKGDEEIVMHTKPAFTIKRYFKALGHKDTMGVAHMGLGSIVLPGTAQIYNRQYWKLPIVYGGIGGCIAGAVAADKKSVRNGLIAGAVAFYWGSILDGVVAFKSPVKPLPARASMYSALLPGLGQAYNGDYWKIPIFYAGFAVSGYCWGFNQKQYVRYKNMYLDLNAGTYKGHLSAENIKWYRDQHRRYRDYSIIATVLIYALNIVDANVFAHFSSFDVSDDLSLNVEPAVINPIVPKSRTLANSNAQPIGLQMNFRF